MKIEENLIEGIIYDLNEIDFLKYLEEQKKNGTVKNYYINELYIDDIYE